MTEEVKAPAMWRKPRMKIYDYNQEFGGNYYQPMIQYLNDKEIQGVYFDKRKERIHLPDAAEVCSDKRMSDVQAGVADLDSFLVKAYAKQIKEINTSTVHSKNEIIRDSKLNTTLTPTLTSTLLRNHYVKQLQEMRTRASLRS